MKIKVLHIIKTLGLGGAEVNLLNLSHSIDQNKYDLHVAYSFGGELEEKFKAQGIKLVKYADQDHRVKSLATLKIVYKLASYIKENKIQIVHTHTFSAHLWGSMAAKLTGCKIVEHVHDFRYLEVTDFTKRRGFNNQYRFIKRFKNISDRVVVLTKQNKEFLIKNNIYSTSRIREYQNGIPIHQNHQSSNDRDALIKEFNLSDQSLIVLTPIRLAPEKNVDLILRIAPSVLSKVPNAVFLIAGDGPLHNDASKQIKDLGLENKIKLIGYHANIQRLLKGSDVFLLPSFLELHSIAILEAMSMKVPVVISKDVGCNSEFISDGKNGYLLDPFKDDGWAEVLFQLLKNTELRQSIGNAGFKTCQDLFDIKHVATKFEALYAELVPR